MMEEDKLRDLESIDKVRETADIGVIISEILCLFAYISCPLYLLSHELWSQKQISYVVTSIGVDLHIITTDLDYGYWNVNLSKASRNKLILGG